jgi:uncharacterized protein YbbC (DUF1343 family)/CubicO group peptidase (beta-lactamase class C family)
MTSRLATFIVLALLAVRSIGPFPDARADGLPEAPPERLGFNPARLARIDAIVERAIADRAVPGAVVVVGRMGNIAYAKAFGRRAVVPHDEPMTRDTLFDLASLTKPVATATSALTLIDTGKLRLIDRLGDLLPEFDNHGKGSITVEQLLRHRAGFIPDNPIGDYSDGPAAAWSRLASIGLTYTPGHGYVYSDVGFEVLGRVVEKAAGKPLDVYASETIFRPLGMADAGFKPAEPLRVRIAPTEPADGAMLRGVVHDPRARALGGVAGHAGLFGTADDLAIYAAMLLNHGRGRDGRPILTDASVRLMRDAGGTLPGQRRGLGWDIDTPHSAPRGRLFGTDGFGHTGFTGTSLWVDQNTQTFVILLTSRLHPDGKGGSPTRLRSDVATAAAAALVEPAGLAWRSSMPVRCGIDALALDGFAPLQGKRVGLVTNHTGLTRDGVPTIDVLHKAPGVTLAALFSPEHGIRGAVDAEVADSRDEATGLPIHSLYGKTRKPSPESLAGLDALVYDIQDIGARFYTYISTLGLVLEAAKEKELPVYVLDRPNPIGGLAVQGPVRDPKFASFIAHHALPVRHGMTVGELALLFNTERGIGADLHVVRCEGWLRHDTYDRTGLVWVNPSPNMRSLTEALLYPGVGLLEATNLATGRGTDTPFERVGAPWIDPVRLANALNDQAIPGVRFTPIRFTPRERQHAGKPCGGVYIAITDRSAFEPVTLGVTMAGVLHGLFPKDWEPDGFLKMLADEAAYRAVLDGLSPREVEQTWADELNAFRTVRARYLIYK